jgi:hypothetical protein
VGSERDEEAVAGIRALLNSAVDSLVSAAARDEALARFVPARRVLLVGRKPALIPIGRVWRLGVLLLDRDATVYATGRTTRAVNPLYPGYQSVSAEERRGYRAAAFRGPFEPGETVNFDAPALQLGVESLRAASGPMLLRDGTVLVRWAATLDAATVPLDAYLAERVDLLLHPPEGAG